MTLDEAIDLFKKGVESERIAHGYLVVGAPRGEAGAFVEKALGLLFCETGNACGSCKKCVQLTGHSHPDVFWMEPEKKSRIISVDQIRPLLGRVYQTSFAGGWKACVLVSADRMGDSAANAFLKTLEEPPKQCVFFLLTDTPQSLLPTILSRCQRITIGGGVVMLPAEWHDRVIAVLSDSGGGSPSMSMSRADRLDRILKEMKAKAKEIEDGVVEASGMELDDETMDARVNARYREMRTGLLQFMLNWYRDILMVVCGGDEDVIYNLHQLDVLRAKAARLTHRQALSGVAGVENMESLFQRNMAEPAVLSLEMSRLA